MTSLAYRQHWIESRPEPLNLSDTEILNWFGENCDQAVWVKATDEHTGGFVIYGNFLLDKPVKGKTIREAVRLAAATLKEAES